MRSTGAHRETYGICWLVLGAFCGGLMLNGLACGPSTSNPATRRQTTAPPKRRAPLFQCTKRRPPAEPPARKVNRLWDCVVPNAPKGARRPVGRLAKPRPILKFAPSVVDFLIRDSKYTNKASLRWYRIAHGKVRLVERITYKKLGFDPTEMMWRNAKELILVGEKSRIIRLQLRDKGGAARLPKRGRRFRVRKVRKVPRKLLPPLDKNGPGESITVTSSGEVWLSRCTQAGEKPGTPFRGGDGCLTWAHGRLLPSYKVSKKAPTSRADYSWKMARPKGYRMQILDECLYCFRGAQGWAMYANTIFIPIKKDNLHGSQWLGRRVPLWAVTVKRIQGDSPNYYYATNLYEACRGYPIGINVNLTLGPRPYLAFRKMYPNAYSPTLFLRYDGQHIGKVVTDRSASVSFRPLPAKPRIKARRRRRAQPRKRARPRR